ncbi:MAG: hypothetical protein GY696_14055 [Gammaproteobacteria bacterium]|nr:hypothetical protein [Gammaproteobacteria bacterium]
MDDYDVGGFHSFGQGGRMMIHHEFNVSYDTGFYPMDFVVDSGANMSLMPRESYDKWFLRSTSLSNGPKPSHFRR